jgi:HTH-type transcriptional repressor of NAD biosynthesis genes
MRRGLVLGKFMPIHKGHIKLIEHALLNCDRLIIWVCVSNKETIPASMRLYWVTKIFEDNPKIEPVLFEYDETVFPNTSESSRVVSKIWSEEIKQNLPPIDVIMSSEKYGDFVAEYLNIEHIYYPISRVTSATDIRNNPYKNWQFIPEIVKPYFYRKICILGTESTGKSILTKELANYFNCDYVSEVGRDIVENTNTCQVEDLNKIAETHANKIILKERELKRILFIDTDINTTKSYSKFLFHQKLEVENWIEKANKCDLYLYLDNDAPFIQDGTRLSEEDRNKLDSFHKKQLNESGIKYFIINGNWNQRFEKSLKVIYEQLGIKNP